MSCPEIALHKNSKVMIPKKKEEPENPVNAQDFKQSIFLYN